MSDKDTTNTLIEGVLILASGSEGEHKNGEEEDAFWMTDEGQSPSFIVTTMMDPMVGNLDRVQTIKGWRDSEGNL